MLKTIEEIKEVEIEAGVVVNGVDNPNMMSVDSTEPVETKADDVGKSDAVIPREEPDTSEKEEKKEEEKEEAKPEVTAETKEEKKVETEEKKVESKPKSESESDSPSVTKRIGKLTKKWRTAERQTEFEKEKRIEAEAKVKELSSKIPDKDKPVKEDFDDEDDYIEALTDWKIDVRFKASQATVVEEIEGKEEKQAVTETYNGLDDAMDRGKEKYEDFTTLVLNEDLIISPELTQILLDTEIPEDIMHFLASDPAESERISALDPIRVAKEVGKIEVRLTKEPEKKTEEKSKPLKKLSKAPTPIESVKTTGVTEKDPNNMSPKEYRAWREKQSK